MITYEVDQNTLQYVRKRLGDLESKAPKVLARAINKTATSARVKIAQKAQSTYRVKTTGFKKDMTIKNATSGNLEAVIKSSGHPLSIVKFKATAPKSGAKAAILKSSGLKQLVMDNIKAFKGPNGQIYQRRGASRLPIKKLSSNSIPVMVGSEKRVFSYVRPKIQEDLHKNIEAQIKLLLSKGA